MIVFEATLVRQTKNYFVYEYSENLDGKPFALYIPKKDFSDTPPKQATVTLQSTT